jgi:hypothetical protein
MAEPFAGMKDILFGYDTDLHFEDGDLKTTTGIDYLEREIYKVLLTSPRDWLAAPRIGASLENFIGQNNTREMGTAIKKHVERSIGPTVFPAQMKVTVVPTSESSLTVIIDIYVQSDVVSRFPFEFNFVSGFKKITLRDAQVTQKKSSNNYHINNISQMTRPNKYYERQKYQR